MRKLCKGALKAACYIVLALLAEAVVMTAGMPRPGEVVAAPATAPEAGDAATTRGTLSFFGFMALMQGGGANDSFEMEQYLDDANRAVPLHAAGKASGQAGKGG